MLNINLALNIRYTCRALAETSMWRTLLLEEELNFLPNVEQASVPVLHFFRGNAVHVILRFYG